MNIGPGLNSAADVFMFGNVDVRANIVAAGQRTSAIANIPQSTVALRFRRIGETLTAEADGGSGFQVVHASTSSALAGPARIELFLIQELQSTAAHLGTFDDLAIDGARFLGVGDTCSGDRNGNNEVTVDEIIAAVNNALTGCAPAAAIIGTYQGSGQEISSGECPGTTGTPRNVSDVVVEVSGQSGSTFNGILSGRRPEGMFSLQIAGTIDASGNLTTGNGRRVLFVAEKRAALDAVSSVRKQAGAPHLPQPTSC